MFLLNSQRRNVVKYSQSNDIDEFEGTEEEYRLARAEALLDDTTLLEVLDTTLRIVVEGKYYEISESGVFYGAEEISD